MPPPIIARAAMFQGSGGDQPARGADDIAEATVNVPSTLSVPVPVLTSRVLPPTNRPAKGDAHIKVDDRVGGVGADDRGDERGIVMTAESMVELGTMVAATVPIAQLPGRFQSVLPTTVQV